MPRSNDQPVIGLAGGIGAGKSAVARILESLGCVVCESDAVARALLDEPEVRDTLVQWWDESILDEGGRVNRSRIAAIVFADADERARLERLIHPRVEAIRREQFAAAPADAPAMVIDAPLLFEAGVDRVCDAVIFVEADSDVRQARLRQDRGWDAAELARREDSQLPLDVKRNRADYVVANNGERERLENDVRRILHEIVGHHRAEIRKRL